MSSPRMGGNVTVAGATPGPTAGPRRRRKFGLHGGPVPSVERTQVHLRLHGASACRSFLLRGFRAGPDVWLHRDRVAPYQLETMTSRSPSPAGTDRPGPGGGWRQRRPGRRGTRANGGSSRCASTATHSAGDRREDRHLPERFAPPSRGDTLVLINCQAGQTTEHARTDAACASDLACVV